MGSVDGLVRGIIVRFRREYKRKWFVFIEFGDCDRQCMCSRDVV